MYFRVCICTCAFVRVYVHQNNIVISRRHHLARHDASQVLRDKVHSRRRRGRVCFRFSSMKCSKISTPIRTMYTRHICLFCFLVTVRKRDTGTNGELVKYCCMARMLSHWEIAKIASKKI